MGDQQSFECIGEPYRCIAMDPPWEERGGGKSVRGAQRHYPVLDVEDILDVILNSKDHAGRPQWRPAADCHLWCWATMNHLPDAMWLVKALGFRYVTHAVWAKGKRLKLTEEAFVLENFGLGRYVASLHELLLLGSRGEARVPDPMDRIPSFIVSPRERHSEKPAVFYERIKYISAGPRLEMFARSQRNGWDVWGNEVV